ncbi:DUF4340 domain-containing protein [Congregibacter litoralis]|uniref:DUF4340 domain-containing protein n=1 Tax=Congregibacter litoralis KT71 TaxID=314285 RepID=A4AC41_9GAMM|nr:DUF4340 domain-containing protein [Congregibacter litoralis]EAQ96491.1 Domain protein of unknown function [Congregibacter litoralis KT71]
MILRILAVLFLAQLALVAYLYWPESPATISRDTLVARLSPGAVNRVEVSTQEGATVVLLRNQNQWSLDRGLPADNDKMRSLLNALLTADPGFPIADSDTAAKRFQVSDVGFVRKIVLSGDDGDATVYLGSTPAMRKIHARAEGESAVFVLPLSSFDAPADIDSWLDTRLLAVQNVTEFALYGVTFTLTDGQWSRSDGTDVEQESAAAFAAALGGMAISGLVDPADDDAGAADEALRVTLNDDGEIRQLAVLRNPESDRYYFDSERFDSIFSTSAYDAERLIDAATSLLATEAKEATED